MALPPLLSPTLPAQFSLPLEPISPTLPQKFNRSLVVKLKYKPMPKIKKRPRVSSTRDFSSSEDEAEVKVVRKELKDLKDKEKDPKDLKDAKKTRELKEPKESREPKEPKENKISPRSPPKPSPKALVHTPTPPTTSVAPKPSTPVAKLPPQYREYRTSLQYWVQQAKKKKHKSDSAISNRQHRLAAVVSMDSIICFIRAFDYEDRADKIAGRSPHTRSWETLVPYLSQMVTYLESVDSDIAGVCFAIRAVLHVYIGQTTLKSRSKQASSSSSSCESILSRAIADFGKGLVYLPLDTITQKYNMKWRENKRCSDKLDPENDECVLPLHVNSTMQDAAAFAFSVAKEWAQHERIDYVMGCEES